MPVEHEEIAHEDAIEHHLVKVAGHTKAHPAAIDGELAIDRLGEYRSALIFRAVTGKICVPKESA